MREYTLEREQHVARTPDQAFDFFSDAHNLEAITPDWLRFRIVTPDPIEMRAGTRIDYRLTLHGIPIRWRTRIEAWEPGRRFVDVQLSGPYRTWYHTHEFEPAPGGGSVIRDHVRYSLPLGPLGRIAHAVVVSRDLRRIFDFRSSAVERLLTS
jgi:ligand-binding SRPBCC domain-containing protein